MIGEEAATGRSNSKCRWWPRLGKRRLQGLPDPDIGALRSVDLAADEGARPQVQRGNRLVAAPAGRAGHHHGDGYKDHTSIGAGLCLALPPFPKLHPLQVAPLPPPLVATPATASTRFYGPGSSTPPAQPVPTLGV
ncbi:hypothetical protein E2562_027863 [Oryza meyeriana var. granulata]|uniref:Uncharacterized protein n=1 Tax=Oryza meyeriana var. granulata TaxID=110450 RepID=A0A6G1DNV2_9ORYZ|nr:hypothetical protein E2562_027863 [Oryza meyeriana var. granulata]